MATRPISSNMSKPDLILVLGEAKELLQEKVSSLVLQLLPIWKGICASSTEFKAKFTSQAVFSSSEDALPEVAMERDILKYAEFEGLLARKTKLEKEIWQLHLMIQRLS